MTTAAAKILVADDDQALLHTLTTILRGKGYEVVPVPGGVDLLDQLAHERPDLLMLDIMMPKVDGLQLLKKVKQDSRWRDLPVLMISSWVHRISSVSPSVSRNSPPGSTPICVPAVN